MKETRRAWTCALLSAALLAGCFILPTSAQQRKRKPVVVSFGQPNIWSLEQAHYLLARMHQENLELRAASLAALDPNETNATRINILKQLLQIGAEFDQGMAVQNQRILRNNEFNDSRRLELISGRDSLRSQALQTQLDINRLTFERAKMEKDGSTQEQKDLKDAELKQRQDDLTAINANITAHNDDISALGAQPSGTPTSPTPSSSPAQLPSGLLEKLPADKLENLFKEAASDAKLNATTKLDNYIQMQYEIVAKQLTLLRDEVGPGERLVFLELPQSIYTTPGGGDEKMAQTWWHIGGYTRTDPVLRLLLELYEVELKWKRIRAVPGYAPFLNSIRDGTACREYAKEKAEADGDQRREDVLRETFSEFQCEYENARTRLFKDLFREARSDFARAQQGGARDTSEMIQGIREALEVKSGLQSGKQTKEREGERSKDAEGEAGSHVERRQEGATAETVEARRHRLTDDLLCLLSDSNLKLDDSKTYLVTEGNCNSPGRLDFKKGIEYVRVDDRADRDDAGQAVTPTELEMRTVRTVDIIPRQSSLNINDIQETVKETGVLAAFKFLFGFAGQVSFERQREQFEQFIHQELYASGFGKGSRDFGWTFGALPGTKRVAPGVRTTYAVLVVPDDAESLVLSARGCYFPRKSYEPLDFEDTSHLDWERENKFGSYNCGDDQTYIVPIPGGGDRSNFWVTDVDYIAGVGDGNRATVSIRGKNFSTQMGVLVNGVPLFPAVGLAQPLLQARERTDADADAAKRRGLALPKSDNCASDQSPGQQGGTPPTGKICGDFERIDPEQIVVSFTMPNSFHGTPTITLVAPGKSVDINPLPDMTVNGVRNTKLADSDFIFGERPKPPKPTLSITDFKVFSVSTDNRQALAILTGTQFTPTDEVYVNGKKLEEGQYEVVTTVRGRGRRQTTITTRRKRDEYKELKSDKLYRLVFNLPPGDELIVTVSRAGAEPVSKSFTNPLKPKQEEKPPGK